MSTLHQLLVHLHAYAPPELAAPWDNVGLMVGDPKLPLKGVAVCVDPTWEAIQAAHQLGANVVVAHHPMLFKAPKRLDLGQEPGRSIAFLIRHDMAMVAAHTNLDAVAVNEALAQALDLRGHSVLDVEGHVPTYLVTVHAPPDAVQGLLEAAWVAGAGRSEGYHRAAYRHPSQGTFTPLPGAEPAEGQVGQASETQEVKLEWKVPGKALKAVRAAVLEAHPYEAPALAVLALHEEGPAHGFGLVGELPQPERLLDFAERVKRALGTPTLRLAGPGDRLVRRVAWLGGSGGKYWPKALAKGAEVYVTGEVGHHEALDGLAAGLCFVEAGHVGTEQPVVPYLVKRLAQAFPGLAIHGLHQQDPLVAI